MSNLTLVIGNKNYSSWSLRPWIFMKHHQIEFTEKRIPLFTETTDQELTPYLSDYKVPVLVDNDLSIWDSLAILEYIAEQYLDSSNGWPTDSNARAIARSVSAEMHSSFTHLRNELPMNCRKNYTNIKFSADTEREIARIKSLWRRCRQEFGADGEWLFGEFSIADAMYAPVVLRFVGYNIPLEDTAASYAQTVLNHKYMIEWIAAGKQETEIIDMNEMEYQ